MARAAEIMLPKRQSVAFPDRCPLCGKQHPGHTVKLEALMGGLLPVSKHVLANWQRELAICRAHESRVRRALVSDALAFAGLSVTLMALLIYLSTRFPMFADGWWSWFGVVVAGLLLPRALMILLARPRFDLRSDDEYVVFVCADPAYAEEFATLNHSQIHASRKQHPFRR